MSPIANSAVLTIAIALLGYVPLRNAAPSGGTGSIQITVSNGERFGTWELFPALCPQNYSAVGFFIKVEPPQGPNADDTALNGVTLICNDPKNTTISSSVGQWGTNTTVKWCATGHRLVGFQLRVEPVGTFGSGDDTAANDINFVCSNGQVLTGDSPTPWGSWGSWSTSCLSIIGISTRVESSQGGVGDDTALNDVKFHCP